MDDNKATYEALLRENQELRKKLATLELDKEAEIASIDDYRKLIFENSHMPNVIMDPDTKRFIDCNQAAIDMYRLSTKDEVLALTPLEVSWIVLQEC